MENISATLIIPTLNRAKTALDTLAKLESQTSDRFEVLVVDQSDRIDAGLKNYRSGKYGYRYIHEEIKNLPNARNIGARQATGDILIFIDDDVVPNDDYVSSYRKIFAKNPGYTVIGGKIREENSRIMINAPTITGGRISCYGKTRKNFMADTPGECDWVVGCNFAVRRKWFLDVGGFDTNYIGNAILEDTDFCFNIKTRGGVVMYFPDPSLHHLREPSGGTRNVGRHMSMYFRSHNTVYFFRKYRRKIQLPLVFLYLFLVSINDWIRGGLPFRGIFSGFAGCYAGFKTEIKSF